MILKKSIILLALLSVSPATQAQTASQTESKWLLERLTGVRWPVDSPVLAQINTLLANNRRSEAAQLAMSQPQFLNITVKQMATRLSTREETTGAAFNDFSASFIGITRDNLDARTLLSGNFYYSAPPASIPMGVTVKAYSPAENTHYEDLDKNRIDLGQALQRSEGQMLSIDDMNTLAPSPEAAGVLTSRAFLGAHATAGTNRRPVEYTMRSFLCSPIEKVSDTGAPDIRIGRDIDRFPGGDHVRFQTSCKGCHTVMDGFRGAFAKFDFANNVITHSAAGGTGSRRPASNGQGVMNKLNSNATVYPSGYATVDNSWINHAVRGLNEQNLGWRNVPNQGQGVQSFGELIANSTKFSECMVQHVFDSVCKRLLSAPDSDELLKSVAPVWEASGYKLKKLYELVALNPNCRKVQVGGK